jgi:hypothetical protein
VRSAVPTRAVTEGEGGVGKRRGYRARRWPLRLFVLVVAVALTVALVLAWRASQQASFSTLPAPTLAGGAPESALSASSSLAGAPESTAATQSPTTASS